jgi:S-DNA-T family DNA segregation ATPase FtsK/SpoIIIE
MHLKRACLPLQEFEKARPALESGMQVYIDEIREGREAGTVDIIYSDQPMPNSWTLDNTEGYKNWTFAVGKTRSHVIECDLKRTPHLLVAGQTGGGKSTFLRQIITTLYLNNPSTTFTLVDLKGGLEFQLFEKLGKRVEVISELESAVKKFERMESMLEKRMALLKARKCKDIDALLSKDLSAMANVDKVDG